MTKKLLFQVGLLITAFLIAVLIVLGFVIYVGSTSMFLNSKNEMIDRDLLRMKEYVMQLPAISSILDYWEQNPESVLSDYTDEEEKAGNIALGELNGEITDSDFARFSDAAKSCIAKDRYRSLCAEINSETQRLDYVSIYLMDIRSSADGFIYCIGNDEDYTFLDSLGGHRDIDTNRQPVLANIRSGLYNDTEYEVYNHENGDSLYIGYAPLSLDGQVKCVICVEYDWSRFRDTISQNLVVMALLGIMVVAILGSVLLGFLRTRVINPITGMQSSIRQYMASKKSTDVISDMEHITANNELGLLANDLSELTVEMDDYISSIQRSRTAMKQLTADVMEALAKAIDAKDEYTNGHSERVAIYARMIAKKLGLSEEEQEKIFYMGLLHDIGKIGIPSSIICKKTSLTNEEFELVQSHPILGYEILEKIKSEPDLALGARWHHEYYDGTGYPDGKKGEEIPFLVRIIAVADSYDAMTSNRSYRQYIPQKDARSEIENNIGTQFDPVAAKCMLEIIDSDKTYALHE